MIRVLFLIAVVFAAPSKRPPPPSDRACTTSADCTLACPSVPGCCGFPCGCRNAMNKQAAARFVRDYAKTCQKPPKCPVVGCAYQPAMGATCRAGACVPVDGPGDF